MSQKETTVGRNLHPPDYYDGDHYHITVYTNAGYREYWHTNTYAMAVKVLSQYLNPKYISINRVTQCRSRTRWTIPRL